MPGVVSVGAGPISGIGASAVTPGPEQPLWQGSPSIALLYGKVVRLVFSLLILVVIGYLAIAKALPALASTSSDLGTFVSVHTDQLKLGIIGFLVLAFIPPVFALVMAAARNRTTRYRVTNQRIVIESGLFSRSLDEIDLRSVDDIEFHQSFLERLFNIGEIALVSTDKVAPRRTLHGIHDPRNTREVIRAAAYHVSQRQLFTRST
jgi:membrane protein YdbS with pleckstrin-like domain